MTKDKTLTSEQPMQKLHGTGNRLQFEQSPYLLQHAGNPVNWYPWGEEAFEAARIQDKPVFLSIGYSTCHWCHVMEKESFEDQEVADLLNKHFIAIKVDREERPDIDTVYMTVTQMLTGSGGWPMTVVMTPHKKPFFAGTYFPKHGRMNRPGLMELLPRINDVWKNDRPELLESATGITESLQNAFKVQGKEAPDQATLNGAYKNLVSWFDELHGGFGYGNKFPTPHRLLFLLRYYQRTGESKALDMVERTLEAMRTGGMYDHIGFGFHRYATDREWLLPHFEKMLYDQALLLMAYTEAWAVTKNESYADTAREIAEYVLRDMTATTGGFYSAEDADSEGKEGAFYVWTEAELEALLGKDEMQLVRKVYSTEQQGNFKEERSGKYTGANILHLKKPLPDSARSMKIPIDELRNTLEIIRKKLYDHRKTRIHPLKDDKILADWNGLMIAALAQAGRLLHMPEYTAAAEKAAAFILNNFKSPDGGLMHRHRNGQTSITGTAEDYAFMMWGLIELYESTFDPAYLAEAVAFGGILQQRFYDDENGGFFLTADNAEQLLVRPKEIYDGAIPSANSVAAYSLVRLARLTGRNDLEDIAIATGTAFYDRIAKAPAEAAVMMMAVEFLEGTAFEVVIAGDSQSEETAAFINALNEHFLPNTLVLLRPTETETPRIAAIAPFTRHQKNIKGQTTAYVCEKQICKRPVTTVAAMLEQLGITANRK